MKQRKCKSKCTAGIRLLLGAMAAGLMGSLALPVRAQDSFGNQVVEFPVDTTVEFEFKESHGAFQSTLGIINLDTNQRQELFREEKPYDGYGTGKPQTRVPGQSSLGTPLDYLGTVQGGTVRNQLSEFTFKANTRYAFYLESVSPTGETRRTVVSTNQLASVFNGALDSGNRGGVIGNRISWDDDGLPEAKRKDNDFDDFVIEAGGYLVTVPCVPVR